MVVATLVQNFDFAFNPGTVNDVTWVSDQFTIGTASRNGLQAVVTRYSS